MKRTLTTLAVLTLATMVHAQVSAPGQTRTTLVPGPNTTGMVSPTVGASNLPPLPTGVNPFTGVTKAQTEVQRSEEELKRLRSLSNQKLTLQKDEIEALKLELERRRLLEALNPPKPTPVVNPATKPASTQPTRRIPAAARPAEPPQIIAPRQSKFVAPEIQGVIEIDGQRIAMMRFDSQNFRVQVGSVVGGRPVSAIAANGIQWGDQFLTVTSGEKVPKMMMTDDRTDVRQAARSVSQQPSIIPPQTQQPRTSSTPPQNVSINPTGAQNNSTGATGPTGILRLPPPPPTLGRQ